MKKKEKKQLGDRRRRHTYRTNHIMRNSHTRLQSLPLPASTKSNHRCVFLRLLFFIFASTQIRSPTVGEPKCDIRNEHLLHVCGCIAIHLKTWKMDQQQQFYTRFEQDEAAQFSVGKMCENSAKENNKIGMGWEKCVFVVKNMENMSILRRW